MSIIHEALKKIEGARQGYTGVRAGSSSTVKRPQRKMTVVLALVTFFVAVFGAIYSFGPEKKPSMPKESDLKGQGAPVVPSSMADGPQMNTPATVIVPEAATWSDVKAIDLFNHGRYSEAAALFAEGVRQDPGNSVLLNNMGLAHFRDGKIAEAESAYKKALAINPSYPEALNNYGALFASRADYVRAIKHYRSAVALRPDYADAYLNSAIASELSGDLKTAVGDYERFLNAADGSKDAGTIAQARRKLLLLRPALIIDDVNGARR